MEKAPQNIMIPVYFFLLGLLILFSLILLFQGATGLNQPDNAIYVLFIIMGIVGLVSTFYMIRRYQVSVQKLTRERKITVLTVEECSKCNYKATRLFHEGDFVYGNGGDCPRCSGEAKDAEAKVKMLITSIYLDKGQQEERV
jgi:hypothetical protein